MTARRAPRTANLRSQGRAAPTRAPRCWRESTTQADEPQVRRWRCPRLEAERRCTTVWHNYWGPSAVKVKLRDDSGPWFEGDAVKIANAREFDYSPFDASSTDGRCVIPQAGLEDAVGTVQLPLPEAEDAAGIRAACGQYLGWTSPTGRWSALIAPRTGWRRCFARPMGTCRGASWTAGTWMIVVPSTTTSCSPTPTAGSSRSWRSPPRRSSRAKPKPSGTTRSNRRSCWGARAKARASGRPIASVRVTCPAPNRSRGSWSPT